MTLYIETEVLLIGFICGSLAYVCGELIKALKEINRDDK